jgi:hypothetical protein
MDTTDNDTGFVVYLNDEYYGEFTSLDGEDIEGLGSGERRGNEIEVYVNGKLIRHFETNHGEVTWEEKLNG